MNPTNYLIMICDQLSATALSAYGNTYSRTPNLDRLAERSAIYEYAYTPCPLCQPGQSFLLDIPLSSRNHGAHQSAQAAPSFLSGR